MQPRRVPAHIGGVVGVPERDEVACPHAVSEYVATIKEDRLQAQLRATSSSPVAPIDIMVFKEHSHAEILLNDSHQWLFVDMIHRNEKLSRFANSK